MSSSLLVSVALVFQSTWRVRPLHFWILLANLVLRLSVWAWSAFQGYWHMGDTNFYISSALSVCRGTIGGLPFRGVLYSWFLYFFTPHLCDSRSMEMEGNLAFHSELFPGFFAVPLLCQTLMVWGVGFLIARFLETRPSQDLSAAQQLASRLNHTRPVLSTLVLLAWLFEPALFAYSHLIMSDAFYALGLFILGFWAIQNLILMNPPNESFFSKNNFVSGACLGFWAAWVALTRTTGPAFLSLSLLGFFIFSLRYKPLFYFLFLRRLPVAVAVFFLVSSPRLVSNYQQHHFLGLHDQGETWLQYSAGIAAEKDDSKEYLEMQLDWIKRHPSLSTQETILVFVHNWQRTLRLWGMGTLRVLLGHSNTEWTLLLSGKAMRGPGWFRATENRPDPSATDHIFIWVSGVLFSLGFCVFFYATLIHTAIKSKVLKLGFIPKVLLLWFSGGFFFHALIPLFHGDARFRMGAWPFLVLGLLLLCLRPPHQIFSGQTTPAPQNAL